MSKRSIEIVYYSGCPHADEARRNVRKALEMEDRDAAWSEWNQASDTTPSRYRGLPSPTVLVNGTDVSGSTPDTDGGFSCRAGGAPTVDRVVSALRGGQG